MAGPIIGWSKKLIDGFRYVFVFVWRFQNNANFKRERESNALQELASSLSLCPTDCGPTH
jgi:hypothetical protein